MKSWAGLFLGMLCAFALIACETPRGVVLKEQPLYLNDIREAIARLAGKPRLVSENQREYTSQYFSRKGVPLDENAPERLFAHFWILGDRKPYDVRVVVVSERKGPRGYFRYGDDLPITKKVAEELKVQLQNLHQSLDESNVIDSMRPF